MVPTTFTFRSRWTLPVPPATVVDRLADVTAYPSWWPQVRRAERLGGDGALVTVRGLVPVPLRLVLTRQLEDRAAGVLRVGLDGDLRGYAEARVVAVPTGCALEWRQEVELVQPVLRRLAGAAPARWALRANHALMMRSAVRAIAREA